MRIDNRSALSMGSPVTLAVRSADWALPRWLLIAATVSATSLMVLLASCLTVLMGLS